jgi:hypothetical protein
MSSNLEVVHAYAHAINPNNRQTLASNNLSFSGTALTSYRLQIGHRVNSTFVISAYASHTPTTTRHVATTLAAIHPQPLIKVFDLAPVDNLLSTKRELEHLLTKAATARSRASDYLAQALTYLESHNALCKLLGQPEHALPVDILNVDLTVLKQQRKEALARELAAKKAREARYAEQHAVTRQKWRDGGPTSGIPGDCMLRLKGSVVQTSQGANAAKAKAAAKVAAKAYAAAKAKAYAAAKVAAKADYVAANAANVAANAKAKANAAAYAASAAIQEDQKRSSPEGDVG